MRIGRFASEDAQPAEQDSDDDREHPEKYRPSQQHHDPDDDQDQSNDDDHGCGTAVHDTGQQRLHAHHLPPTFPRDRGASIPFFYSDPGHADRGNLGSSAARMAGPSLAQLITHSLATWVQSSPWVAASSIMRSRP